MYKYVLEGRKDLPIAAGKSFPGQNYLKEINKATRDKIVSDSSLLWDRGFFEVVLNQCQKLIAEAYYCGFIAYYDQQARGGFIDHDIFFDWHDCDDNTSRVDVYLFPGPIKKVIEGECDKLIKGYAGQKSGGGSNQSSKKNPMAPPPSGSTLNNSDPPTTQGPPPPPVGG